jgi:hypothetical protein
MHTKISVVERAVSQLPSSGIYLDSPPVQRAFLHLAIAEHASARMSFGQWRGSGWLAEISCPLPVPDLRHIFEMLSDVVVVFVQLPVEHVDYIRNL